LLGDDGWSETGGLEADEPVLETKPMGPMQIRDVLGEHFTWDEVTRTKTGLPNPIDDDSRRRFQQLHDTVLAPLRAHLGRPIIISSGFRSPAVNKAVGGSSTSRHLTGEAADIKVPGMAPEAVAATIRKLGLPVDQVIWYDSWVHVGIRAQGLRGEYRISRNGAYPLATPDASLAV
jgi:hypothetical protein